MILYHGTNIDFRIIELSKSNKYKDFYHDYDIVIGPIANDGVAYLLGRYEEGTLSI